MDKFNDEESDKISQYLLGNFIELGQYMEEHHFPNKLVMDCFAVAIAFLLTPPKGTEEIFADTFKEKLLETLNEMEDFKTALGLKDN